MIAVETLLGRSAVRLGRTGEDLAAIRQRDAAGIGDVAAILGGKTLYRDLVSHFQSSPPPTLTNKGVRAAHFESPVGDFAAFILHVDVKPYMWIGPFQAGNGSRHFDAFVGVELRGEGVMR